MSDSLTNIEAMVREILSIVKKQAAQQPTTKNGKTVTPPAADHMLNNSWADKEVRKAPLGCDPSIVGRRFSQLTADEAEKVASFFDWRSDREEAEGKTYVSKKTGEEKRSCDSSRFDASIARAWAVRARKKPATKSDFDDSDEFGDKQNGFSFP